MAVSKAAKEAYKKQLEQTIEAPKSGVVGGFSDLGGMASSLGSGDYLGGITKGITGLSSLYTSPEGQSLAANQAYQSGDQELANAYLQNADSASNREAALAAAYQQAKQSQMDAIGQQISAEDAANLQRELASTQANTARGVAAMGQETELAKERAKIEQEQKMALGKGLSKEDQQRILEQGGEIKQRGLLERLGSQIIPGGRSMLDKYKVITPQESARESVARGGNIPESAKRKKG